MSYFYFPYAFRVIHKLKFIFLPLFMILLLISCIVHLILLVVLRKDIGHKFSILCFIICCVFLHLSKYNMYLKILSIQIIYLCSTNIMKNTSIFLFILFGALDLTRNFILKWIKKEYMKNLLSEDRILMMKIREYFTDCETMFLNLSGGLEENILSPNMITENLPSNDENSNEILDQSIGSEDLAVISDSETVVVQEHNLKLPEMSNEEEVKDEYEEKLKEGVVYAFNDAPISDLQLPSNFYLFEGKMITKKSIYENIPDNNKAELLWQFLTFYDTDSLTYQVFKNYHTQITREYTTLDLAFKSAHQVLTQLNIFLIIFQYICTITCILLIYYTDRIFVGAFYSIFSFVFLPSIKHTIEAFLFLIITHPFDSGDRVYLNGDNLIVKKLSLFVTEFEKWDGKIVYITNGVLMNSSLGNARRARKMKWEHSFYTSDALGMIQVAADMENLGCRVFKEAIEESYMCKYRFLMEHKWNFQSGFFMWKEHNKYEKALLQALQRANVRYLPLTQRYVVVQKA